MSAFLRRLAPLLALLAAAVPIALQGQGASAFGLAVLRRDGVLIPFASFSGRTWSTEWPGDDPATVLPISLADIPKRWWGAAGPAARWTAWLLDGDPHPLTLQKPQQVTVFCGTRLGVMTDHQGGAIDPREPTVPKDGVAIAGSARLLPIVPVSIYSADAKKIVEAITDGFN